MPAAAATDYAPADYAAMRPPVEVQDKYRNNQQREEETPSVVGSDGSSAVCDYRSAPNLADHETFVRDAVRLMLENAVFRGTDRRRPVLNWKSPEELCAAFDFQLNRSATTHGHLLRLIEGTIEHSVKTGHPYFVNQLFSRCVEISQFNRVTVYALLFIYTELILFGIRIFIFFDFIQTCVFFCTALTRMV